MGSKGVVNGVCKIFGMFDKIDDIIYEPVKVMCDALRAPVDKYNAKNKAELDMRIKEYEVELDLRRKQRENEMTVEQQKAEEEIRQWILDKDLKRREQMVQLEMRYRKEMAEAAFKLEQIMANMSVETRRQILDLYQEKIKQYIEMQQAFKDDFLKRVDQMKQMFSGERAEIMRMEYCYKQLDVISERSNNFIQLLNKDQESVLASIDFSMKEMTGLATKYFKPAEPNEIALSQHAVNKISQ